MEKLAGVSFSWCRLELVAEFPVERFAALNPAFIRFSSGTTGTSKGVLLGHETLLARVRSANRRLQISREDRVLWTLPMAHHFAVSIMLYLLEGATTVLEDSHLAAEVLASARETGATVFYGSPFHLALLAAEDSGRVGGRGLGGVAVGVDRPGAAYRYADREPRGRRLRKPRIALTYHFEGQARTKPC